jgi:hypothetical protein
MPRSLRLAASLVFLLAVLAPLRVIAADDAPADEAPADEAPADEAPAVVVGLGQASGQPVPAILRCVERHEPCFRPHPARIILAVSGLAAGAAGAVLTFVVADRAYAGDPNYLLVGGGMLTAASALVGQLFAIPGNEWAVAGAPYVPPVVSLGLEPGGWAGDGQLVPPIPMLRASPALRFGRGGGTLRLDVGLGVQAGRVQRGYQGEGHFRTHEVRFDGGPRLALPLPYLLSHHPKAPRTGQVELLYEPSVRVRWYALIGADDVRRTTERMTLLPLSFGVRWHLSPRQRFTLLVGPRWDFQKLMSDGEVLLPMGRGQANNFHGQLTYVIDVPFAPPGPGGLEVVGQLSLGYEQWKGDGHSMDWSSVIGYLGPFRVGWTMQFRKPGSELALLVSTGALLGTGGGGWIEIGLGREPLLVGGAR